MNKRSLRIMGMIFSLVIGFELEIFFYILLNINPANVPIITILFFWIVNSVLSGCVVDEIFKRKFHIRLIKKNIIAHF